MQLALFAVGACVYGLFARVLTAKLGEHSPISRLVVPVSIPVLLQLAKGDSATVLILDSAFLVGWAHDELVKMLNKLMGKQGGD